MSEKKVIIDILENSGYWALCINNIRYGPDAGPWKVVATFNIKESEFFSMATADSNKCLSCNGTGRDPMSDNANWLPCTKCNWDGHQQTTEVMR